VIFIVYYKDISEVSLKLNSIVSMLILYFENCIMVIERILFLKNIGIFKETVSFTLKWLSINIYIYI
jgi:hypothetical protein